MMVQYKKHYPKVRTFLRVSVGYPRRWRNSVGGCRARRWAGNEDL